MRFFQFVIVEGALSRGRHPLSVFRRLCEKWRGGQGGEDFLRDFGKAMEQEKRVFFMKRRVL
jgi:hypothetical protein